MSNLSKNGFIDWKCGSIAALKTSLLFAVIIHLLQYIITLELSGFDTNSDGTTDYQEALNGVELLMLLPGFLFCVTGLSLQGFAIYRLQNAKEVVSKKKLFRSAIIIAAVFAILLSLLPMIYGASIKIFRLWDFFIYFAIISLFATFATDVFCKFLRVR